MVPEKKHFGCHRANHFARRVAGSFLLAAVTLFTGACAQLERPTTEPFFAETPPPRQQEFRWSNGKTPKSFDPARAAAPPETDIVRAVYEGLTDLDPKSLKAVPGIAEKWESSTDLKIWTFHLRKDARWSNAEPVTAGDFVSSWKRLVGLKDKVANKFLFQNIVGMKEKAPSTEHQSDEPTDFIHDAPPDPRTPFQRSQPEPHSVASSQPSPHVASQPPAADDTATRKDAAKFGVEAVDDLTLQVTLETPDKDFPQLVANPIFRPVYGDGKEFDKSSLDTDVVTNGAFRLTSTDNNAVTVERSDNYWNRQSVGLERVRFVSMETPEKALEAYRAGSIDAVSNAEFEPLALKLLTPFDDFRRSTHSALNFYEVNPKNAPFSDRRIREALAISIDRVRLTEGELEGSTRPAYSFLPLSEPNKRELSLDVVRAKDLMAKAGYENGKDFPQIRLVVNRNDTQQRVAKTVAKMWKDSLNVDTQIIVKESSEMEKTRAEGDFDLIRRGAVMPTPDEFVSLSSVFGPLKKSSAETGKNLKKEDLTADVRPEKSPPLEIRPLGGPNDKEVQIPGGGPKMMPTPEPTLSEEDSIFDIFAIPLYFPTSYSLVKPYVRGFEMNGLDAPLLREVTIDNAWQPKATRGES
jgi:oligopeptide transport system substrate-binding protein